MATALLPARRTLWGSVPEAASERQKEKRDNVEMQGDRKMLYDNGRDISESQWKFCTRSFKVSRGTDDVVSQPIGSQQYALSRSHYPVLGVVQAPAVTC